MLAQNVLPLFQNPWKNPVIKLTSKGQNLYIYEVLWSADYMSSLILILGLSLRIFWLLIIYWCGGPRCPGCRYPERAQLRPWGTREQRGTGSRRNTVSRAPPHRCTSVTAWSETWDMHCLWQGKISYRYSWKSGAMHGHAREQQPGSIHSSCNTILVRWRMMVFSTGIPAEH